MSSATLATVNVEPGATQTRTRRRLSKLIALALSRSSSPATSAAALLAARRLLSSSPPLACQLVDHLDAFAGRVSGDLDLDPEELGPW